jgi:hypothetical protein
MIHLLCDPTTSMSQIVWRDVSMSPVRKLMINSVKSLFAFWQT